MENALQTEIDLRSFIRDVPDFPKSGILFKDITPLLGSASAFDYSVQMLSAPFLSHRVTKVAAIESRGFIFGGAIARDLGCGFVPIRKPGNSLDPASDEYTLEYGTGALEIHDDALSSRDRVLIVDDVLATGGTAAAAITLVTMCGAEVAGLAFLIELLFLNGRAKLAPSLTAHSLIPYD